jgi:ATP-dependent Clp protease protease subunit
LVASAGTIMCVIADEKYMTANAHAMIHELSSGNSGRYTQMVSYTKHLDQLENCLMSVYLTKTHVSKKKLIKLLKNDTWYTAAEYLKHGFIDGIK